MNYLAHIHLASTSNTSLVGNFLGDFVKGKQYEVLAPDLQRGVKLHRAIDSFTDEHAIIQGLKQDSPIALRRMIGVVLDVYFDLLLIQHWDRFTGQPLEQVTGAFYQELENIDDHVSVRFQQVRTSLLMHQWLRQYHSLDGCIAAFLSIEKRLKRRIDFAHLAQDYLKKYGADIEEQFLTFYPHLIAFVIHHPHVKESHGRI